MSLESALVPISAAAWAVVVMLFVYDAKRALWPRIPIALLVVLRCSIPLKRLVASRLFQPRDS